MKSERNATLFRSNRVGNHRVARRGSDSFAHAIGKPDREHLCPRLREREQRPGN
jgi:hypothetical protein